MHIRNQLDLGWRLENQSVYIYETRPVWNNPSEYQTELNRAAHKSAGVVDFQKIKAVYFDLVIGVGLGSFP
ncbi:DUF3024 domain-containing protein [Marinomonas spartinae]|uniref:DUF3024 domain-containing protein n=1 Tax=Marinomonas spartinae TaxID=1792290 RepID=UPI003F99CB85